MVQQPASIGEGKDGMEEKSCNAETQEEKEKLWWTATRKEKGRTCGKQKVEGE